MMMDERDPFFPLREENIGDLLLIDHAEAEAMRVEVERLKKAIAIPDDRSSEDFREALRSEMIILGGKAYKQIADLEDEIVRLRAQADRAKRERDQALVVLGRWDYGSIEISAIEAIQEGRLRAGLDPAPTSEGVVDG